MANNRGTMKSDACSGMISQMSELSTTVNSFSSSINDHETRIQGLEASSGGLYKADSYGGWLDLYLPSQNTGTFGRLHAHATNETGYYWGYNTYSQHTSEDLFDMSIYGWSSNTSQVDIKEIPGTSNYYTLRLVIINYSLFQLSTGMYSQKDNDTFEYNKFNGVYTFNVRYNG